jgi:uncharacterized protein DUF6265
MKTLCAAVSILLLAASGSAAAAEPVAQRLGWLAGCWGGQKGTTAFREIWTVAAPDLMVAVSVTTKPSKPAEFEYLRIEMRGGKPTYVAQPGGAPPTTFELSAEEEAADTAMFVNMQHDFPKRVAYKRGERSSLLAWIDAGPQGTMRIEFPMKRVPCPGETR